MTKCFVDREEARRIKRDRIGSSVCRGTRLAGLVLAAVTVSGTAPSLAQSAPQSAPAAPTAPAADPVRQAAADRAVAALVPKGIYKRMMRDQFPKMMDAMTAQMMGMSPAELGLPAQGDGKTLMQAANEKDPHFRERLDIMTKVMSEEMGEVFDRIEPQVRAGLGRAFARKFTTAQLDDMNRFFATPSGKAFADEYLLLFMDPEMMREMTAATPEIMKAMPRIMQRVEAATQHLPPPPKPATGEGDEPPVEESSE